MPDLSGQEEPFPEPDNQSKMKRSCENAEHVGQSIPIPALVRPFNLCKVSLRPTLVNTTEMSKDVVVLNSIGALALQQWRSTSILLFRHTHTLLSRDDGEVPFLPTLSRFQHYMPNGLYSTRLSFPIQHH